LVASTCEFVSVTDPLEVENNQSWFFLAAVAGISSASARHLWYTRPPLSDARLYRNLLGKREGLEAPLPKAEALREAKHWLRALSADEAGRLKAQLPGTSRGEKMVDDLPAPSALHPYEHPYYWAAFILIGDPGDLPLAQAGPARFSNFWLVVGGLLTGVCVLGAPLVWLWRRYPSKMKESGVIK